MNLQELQENKKTKIVKRALREHYEIDIDFEKLNLKQTQGMLVKVRGLLKESSKVQKNYNYSGSKAALKLVMLEQALTDRLNDLRNPAANIVVENEEVQKSQVILAAQDMIDTLQKMLEDISKMNVEELNAVVDGMKNEFGTSAGDQFGGAVGTALSTLQEAITAAKTAVTGALGAVTGEGGGMPAPDAGAEMGAGMGTEMPAPDASAEMPAPDAGVEMPAAPEEEEPEDVTGAGRGRR